MGDSQCYAVLTGDIVASTSLGADRLEAVRDALAAAAGEIGAWRDGLVAGGPEFFRGDAWQLALAAPGMALRAGLFLRATLIAHAGADTRLAIGIGGAEKIQPRQVSLSTGEAFALSGRALDAMPAHLRLAIAAPALSRAGPDWPPVVAGLCDALVSRWTPRQAEAICVALHPSKPLHKDIAEKLTPSVTRQAVSDALASAQWRPVSDAISFFEEIEWNALAAR